MNDLSHLYGRIARYLEGADPTPPLICFFGDSNTCGWGRETIQHREAYPARVLDGLHERFPSCLFNGLNAGKGGDTAVAALGRLERDVLRHGPDLVVLAFGINDAMGGPDGLPRFEAAVRALIAAMGDHAALVLLTPNMMATRASDAVPDRYRASTEVFIAAQTGGALDAYVGRLRATARELGVPLADAYRTWRGMARRGVDTTALLANGLNHPFGHAHRFFADAILACIDGAAPHEGGDAHV